MVNIWWVHAQFLTYFYLFISNLHSNHVVYRWCKLQMRRNKWKSSFLQTLIKYIIPACYLLEHQEHYNLIENIKTCLIFIVNIKPVVHNTMRSFENYILQIATVPSVCVLLCGPDVEGVRSVRPSGTEGPQGNLQYRRTLWWSERSVWDHRNWN